VHQQALLEHYCGNAQFDRLMDRPFEEKQTLAFYRERGLDAVPFLKFLTQRTLAGLPVSSLKPLMLQQRLVTEMAMPSRSADQLNTLAQCLARLAESPESLAPMLLSGYALWQPWQPLPSGLVFALRAAGAQGERVLQPQNLFRSIGQLGLENDYRRSLFAMAVMESLLLGDTAHGVSATVAPDEQVSCDVCFSDLAVGDTYTRLTDHCQTAQCNDCVANSLSNLNKGNQCQWGCNCTVHSETAMVLNASPAVIQEIQTSTVAAYFARVPRWQNCEETICVGGKPPTEKSCQLCHDADAMKPQNAVIEALSTQKRTVKMLIDHIGKVSGHHNGDGMERECFCCGLSVVKDRNCAKVTCVDSTAGGCGQTYDFVGGDRPGEGVREHHFYYDKPMPAQAYIPARQKSVLWQLGFYDRNPFVSTPAIPKTHNPGLMRKLIATKDQWYALYEQKIDQLIEQLEAEQAQKDADEVAEIKLSSTLSSFSAQSYFGKTGDAAAFEPFYLPGDPVCFKNQRGFWEQGHVQRMVSDDQVWVEDAAGKVHKLTTGGPNVPPTCLPFGSMPTLPDTLLAGDRVEVYLPVQPESAPNITGNGLPSGVEKGRWTFARVLSHSTQGLILEKQDGESLVLKAGKAELAAAGSHERSYEGVQSTQADFDRGMSALADLMNTAS
jgi:hypothetical protein